MTAALPAHPESPAPQPPVTDTPSQPTPDPGPSPALDPQVVVAWLQFLAQQLAFDPASNAALRKRAALVDLAACWPKLCPPTWTPPAEEPPTDHQAAWEAAWGDLDSWEGVITAVAEALDMDWAEARALWTQGRRFRLVLPTGMLSQAAQLAVAAAS